MRPHPQVGFGNVAAETDNEKVFTICMMIIAGAVFDTFRCHVQLRFQYARYNELINAILYQNDDTLSGYVIKIVYYVCIYCDYVKIIDSLALMSTYLCVKSPFVD